MYEFVTLDDEQKHARRQLLDRYGHIAQASILLPFLLIQAHFLIAWLDARSRQRAANEPSSPVQNSHRSSRIGTITAVLRKLTWWAGDDLEIFNLKLGTRGEALGAFAWFAWLLVLCFLQTGNDYLHLTKRFGIVAASQLPLHYLLAIKTPYSPLQALTRTSHESLNAIHQILGRIVTILIYAHVVLYLNFYVQSGLLTAKLKEAYVLCGLVAAIFFTFIGTSSLEAVRRASYRTFLGVHIILSIAILPTLFFHVSHIREYLYETAIIVLLNLIFRATTAKSYTTASVALVPNTGLIDVSIKHNSSTARNRWHPGQHAYLSLPGHAIKAALAKNPFTLASVPSIDGYLRFVARIQSGNTTALAAAASEKSVHHILVEGPYGLATHGDDLLRYDKVLLVAGGIGATFIVPLYRQLLADLSPSKGSHRRQKVTAVWVLRSLAEARWALPDDDREKDGFLERLSIYVTGSADQSRLPLTTDGVHNAETKSHEDEEGVEMEERANLLTVDMEGSEDTKGFKLSVTQARPNLPSIVREVFAGGSAERVAVVVCGPDSLSGAIRQEVGHWIHKGRDVWFWNERFSL